MVYISYFVTYPLLVLFLGMFAFFCYNFIMAGRDAVTIEPEDSVEAYGEIIKIRSTSGGNASFVNVLIQVKLITANDKVVNTEGKAVIDVIKIAEYQKGAKVPLVYSRKDPMKIKLNIPSPLDR
ncbi:hypothetical protein ACSX9W_11225 [Kosakonia cowanii]|uniref:hypothetical protein n=1 Tax=Kosakonia cowanii TaxID=208223 RepID=UPI003F696512